MKIVKIIPSEGNYAAIDSQGKAYVLVKEDSTTSNNITFAWVQISDTPKKSATQPTNKPVTRTRIQK